MAKLVAVCRSEDYPFERRQIPLVVDDSLTMVMEFGDTCVGCEQVGIKQKELERFVSKFRALSSDEIAVALMVTNKDIFNLLTQMVPCVGCRRSVERLFAQLVESGHPALEPLVITRSSVLSIIREYLFDPKAIHALFYVHGSQLNTMMESIPKSKKNKRCMLHSLDTHKVKSLGSWVDIWDLLSIECREEVILVECDSLQVTLDNYLRKHRFCAECKSKVQRAYSILVGDTDKTEKGYCPALYENLRCCPGEKHIHVSSKTDYIAQLIGRAEPELTGSRRERHAKTLDIAQEEVLTCLGIYLYERLYKIWQKLRAEEQTWQILFYLGVDALKKNFEMALEKKQGISNLELVCRELLQEEQDKEQRRKQRRQKKRNKKNKGQPIPDPELDLEKDKENCKCDENTNLSTTTCATCDDHNSNLVSVETTICRCDANDQGGWSGGGPGESGTGGNRSDCGYSSGHEGCESCGVPSSHDGSDVGCSEGLCNHDGDSPLCNRVDLGDVCQECLSASCHDNSPTHSRSSPSWKNKKCDVDRGVMTGSPTLDGGTARYGGQVPSLQDMLEASCSSGEEEEVVISEEEIRRFKANASALDSKRQQLRETLRQRFANMRRNGCCVQQRGSARCSNPQCLGSNGRCDPLAAHITKLSMN